MSRYQYFAVLVTSIASFLIPVIPIIDILCSPIPAGSVGMRSVLEMSFDAEVLATYLAALSELASLKEVILGLPRPGGSLLPGRHDPDRGAGCQPEGQA